MLTIVGVNQDFSLVRTSVKEIELVERASLGVVRASMLHTARAQTRSSLRPLPHDIGRGQRERWRLVRANMLG